MKEITMDEFYELEYNRVPALFKFNIPKSRKFLYVLIGLTVIAGVILGILPHTQEVHDSGIYFGFTGVTIKYVTYSRVLWIIFVVITVITFFVALWFFIGVLYDKWAYKTASKKYTYYMQECQMRDLEKFKEHRRKQESYYTYK